MSPYVYHPDRRFQIWHYGVGLRQLLLRGTKGDAVATRIDILFQNVKFMQIPTTLQGLMVRDPTDEELDMIMSASKMLPDEDRRFFVLEGDNYRGFVVAGWVGQAEDEGSYSDPSPFWSN
jgi:hypothetical protein